jgi:hypothetical protein
MKKHLVVFGSLIVGFTLVTARAQPGSPPGPSFDAALAKLFGDNSGFSATLEFHTTGPSGEEMTMPGKIAFLDGNARFEIEMAKMQGRRMPPEALARMKQMGMDKMITISRRDKKLAYIIYPGMQAYVEQAIPEAGAGAGATAADYKAEVTKLGEETIDGHDCVKNKVVVTGPDGATHESTVWNATDLKKFPVKIEMAMKGGAMVMLYKEVKLEKPDAAQFDPPADFQKYDNMMGLMMSRRGGLPTR